MTKIGYFRASVVPVAAALAVILLAAVDTEPAEAGAFPGKNGKIAFSSNRATPTNPTGDYEIFTMNPDGSGIFQVTRNTAFDSSPSWSPGGKRIAYGGEDPGPDTDSEILTVSASGGTPTNVTDNDVPDYYPSWSPDAGRIAYVSYDPPYEGIYTISPGGGAPDNVVDAGSVNIELSWSPDGTSIAYQNFEASNYEILRIGASGGAPTNVTNSSTSELRPSWSPNGEKIAYDLYDPGSNREIYTVPVGRGAPINVTSNTVDERNPSWSPDGARIAYQRDDGSSDEIFTISAAGGTPTRLTNNGAQDIDPDWQRVAPPHSNPAFISVVDDSPADPYPSTVNVSGLEGKVSDLDVTLRYVAHSCPSDLDVLLVGPSGRKTVLMSDAGGCLDVDNEVLTFDDSAAGGLSGSAQITSGAYRTTNADDGSPDTFPAPAPAGPYGQALSAFKGTSPNGAYRLYVVDDAGEDAGSIFGGFGLKITTDAAKPLVASPRPVPGSKTRDRAPLVSAKVRDAQTNLAKANIKLYLDNKPRPFAYSPATDRLTYRSRTLSYGRHTVHVVARDAVGNVATRRWGFTVVK